MMMHLRIISLATACLIGGTAAVSAAVSNVDGQSESAKPQVAGDSLGRAAKGREGAAPAATTKPDQAWSDARRLAFLSDRLAEKDEVMLADAQTAPAVPYLGPAGERDYRRPYADGPQYREALDDSGSTGGGYYGGSSWCAAESYEWQLMPQGLIYRSYLAGAKESRFRSEWNEESTQGSIWDVSLGGNVGLARYGTRGDVRPEGWQVGIEGAGLLRLASDADNDVDAADYRFGIPVTWGDSIYQVKFAYYHLSSHLGDEFLLKNPGYPRLNYSRDVFVWGHSLYPADNLRVYGEIGYAFYTDVSDPWELQFGIDYSPNGSTGARGAPFAAVNGHLREEVDFGGNLVAQAGWAWRRSPATGLYRVGVEYYNGKDDQFSFFDNSVEKIGLGMWYDY